MSGSADSRVSAVRDRLNVIKQCVLRNEHFAPSTLPSRDRDRLVTVSIRPVLRMVILTSVQLKSTKQLLGRAGERFLLLGMLARSKEGKLVLEDTDGSVELDFSQLVRRFCDFSEASSFNTRLRMDQGMASSLRGVLLSLKENTQMKASWKLLPLVNLLVSLDRLHGMKISTFVEH